MTKNATELITKLLDRYECAVHELDVWRAVISTLPEQQHVAVLEAVDRLSGETREARRLRFAGLRLRVSDALQCQVEQGMLLGLLRDDQKPN